MSTTRKQIEALMPRAHSDLAELVSYRSVADPRQFPPEECAKTAQWVQDAFADAGLTGLRQIETPDGSKAVYGERPGPAGAPTVLLYAHYDVQPPLDDAAWRTPPFALTEKDGRWYGRGSADCKGNIVMHLTALRALAGNGGFPVGLKLIVEGSEEQGTGGLERYVPTDPDLLRADTILVCDTGNAKLGLPTVTTSLRGLANVVVTVRALGSEMHSGMFGGAAPDALAALIAMLATLRDADGNTTVRGLDNTQTWTGVPYDEQQFRTDANVLDGVSLLGSGAVARHAVGPSRADRPGHRLPTGGRVGGGDPADRAGPAQPAGAAGDGRGRGAEGAHRPPEGGRALGRPRRGRAGGDRGAVPRVDRRPGVRGAGRGDEGVVRQGADLRRAGRIDPAVQRLP